MIKVVLLGMGGPITTIVAATLYQLPFIDLVCIIKPINSTHKIPLAKKLFVLLPNKLQLLIRKYRIRFRNKIYWQLPDVCEVFNIKVNEINDINSKEACSILSEINPDFILIANYNQILKATVINIPKVSCLNLHPSLLPKYRGANPIFWMFKNNESVGGITLHLVDAGIDTGDIIYRKEFELSIDETVVSYTNKCANLADSIITNFFESYWKKGGYNIIKSSKKAPYYPKPQNKDGQISDAYSLDILYLYRNIKAMQQSVSVYVRFGGRRFYIKKATLVLQELEESVKDNKVVISMDGNALVLKGRMENVEI